MKYGIVMIESGKVPVFDQHVDPWEKYWEIAGDIFAGIMELTEQPPNKNAVTYRMFPRCAPDEYDPSGPHKCVLVCAQGPGKRQHNRMLWGEIPVSGPIMICGETEEGYLIRISENEAKVFMDMYYHPEKIRKKKIDGRFCNVVEYIE